jgi:hypothetical protein
MMSTFPPGNSPIFLIHKLRMLEFAAQHQLSQYRAHVADKEQRAVAAKSAAAHTAAPTSVVDPDADACGAPAAPRPVPKATDAPGAGASARGDGES